MPWHRERSVTDAERDARAAASCVRSRVSTGVRLFDLRGLQPRVQRASATGSQGGARRSWRFRKVVRIDINNNYVLSVFLASPLIWILTLINYELDLGMIRICILQFIRCLITIFMIMVVLWIAAAAMILSSMQQRQQQPTCDSRPLKYNKR